jgi:hypothetical protein
MMREVNIYQMVDLKLQDQTILSVIGFKCITDLYDLCILALRTNTPADQISYHDEYDSIQHYYLNPSPDNVFKTVVPRSNEMTGFAGPYSYLRDIIQDTEMTTEQTIESLMYCLRQSTKSLQERYALMIEAFG